MRSDKKWSGGMISPVITTILLLAFFVPGASLSLAASIATAPDPRLAQSVLILDRGISALSKPGADYRKVLESALAALPGNDSDSVKAGITRFLGRAPTAGADFKCSPEFLRYRAQKELVRLKDALPDSKVAPIEPQACYATPFAIDAAQAPASVDIYGFDLDQVSLEMFLITSDGFQDVSFALTRNNHHHLTLKLGAGGVPLASNSQVLGLTWGHLIRYSIPIIQPTTPLCQSRIEDIPRGKRITYPPPRIQGDSTFPGHGAKVWSVVMLDHESNKLEATVCMTAMRQAQDRTLFNGCGGEYVYTTEPERVIERVLSRMEGDIEGTYSGAGSMIKDGVPGGPVRKWTFAGLSANSSAKQETQVTVELDRLRVVSTDASNDCVSTIAYLEAKRTNALGRDTIERLDAKLTNADSGVLKLRPRFAPPASDLRGDARMRL